MSRRFASRSWPAWRTRCKLFIEPSQTGPHWEELERQADLSYANKDWETAFNIYSQLLTASEQTRGLPVARQALALFRRGFCYGQKQDIDRAIADYTAAIELPGAPLEQVTRARFNRGFCYGQKLDVEQAIADYTAVIEQPAAPVELAARARPPPAAATGVFRLRKFSHGWRPTRRAGPPAGLPLRAQARCGGCRVDIIA